MDITTYFEAMAGCIAPILALSGLLSLFVSLVCMLIDIIINSCCGRGMKF